MNTISLRAARNFGRNALVLFMAAVALLIALPSPAAFAATSCSPGQASVIGTEYVADKCPWEGSVFNYYTTDLQCISGIVQRNPMSSGDMYYQNVLPQSMHNYLAQIAPWYSSKIFRDTPGTRFVMVDRYFANGGKLDGKSMSVYPIAPTMNYDVFTKVLYKNPNATVPCCLRIMSLEAAPQTIKPILDEKTTISGTIYSNFSITWTLEIAGQTINGSGTSVNYTWDGKDGNGRPLPPKVYTAILTADSNGCTTTGFVSITVTEPLQARSCPLYAPSESSVNVAGGNLIFSNNLFSAKGGMHSAAFSVSYDSFASRVGALGLSWSHNYEISVQDGGNDSLLFREGNSKRLYTFSGGVYVSPQGDYSTLVKNADGTVVVTEKNGLRYDFDASGKITAISDRNGAAIAFAYTGGNLSNVTDANGRTISFSYDAANRLSAVSDPGGNSFVFTYSGDSLTKIQHPDGGFWSYGYDTAGFMTTKQDPNGNVVTYTYDGSHRMTSATDPSGKTRNYTYPSDVTVPVRSTAFTEKDGGVWQYTYDTEKGTLSQKTDPQGGTTSHTYDTDGNRLTSTGPDGSVTSYTYDAQGNMLSSTDAQGQATTYTYNASGQVLTVTDPMGRTTTNAYDAKGNLSQTVDAIGAKTTYSYDAKGNLVTITDALNRAITFTYDAANNLVSTKDPSGATTTFTYDAMGNLLTQTDPLGNLTRFEYDAMNRLTKATNAQGNVTTYTYDAKGNKVSQTDANGKTTTFAYNYQGQPLNATDALGNATTFMYSSSGCASCGGGVDKLTSLTDANGNITTYEYDSLGRLVKEIAANVNATTYSYDARGNLTSRTDANGNTTTYQYDSVGRLLKKTYPDNSEETFTYDSIGNMLTAANQHSSYSFTYDAKGRLVSVTDRNGRTVGYEYDLLGNRTRLIAPDSRSTTYNYDANNRLTKLTTSTSSFSFAYDKLGRRITVLKPNGARDVSNYDSLGNLLRLYGIAGSPITYYGHTYDKIGNRLTRAERTRTFSYAYDPVYRLTGTTASVAGANEAYSYDPVGNRLTGPAAESYSYATANELAAKTGATYQYDNNGNLVGKTAGTTTWSYAYDFENRLKMVTKTTGGDTTSVTFAYDPFGRRIEKSVNAGTPTTTSYLYDGNNILYEYDGSAAITARYIHNLGVDDPLAVEKNDKVYVYYKDGLGSVTALTDYWGNIVQTYDYDSFGNIVAVKDPDFVQPYTYTGREWDKETGLYFYRARYYDPMEGRFISKDSIGFRGGDVNLYGYVQNNPIRFKDPYGLFKVPDVGAILEYIGCMCKCVSTLLPYTLSGNPFGNPYDIKDIGTVGNAWGWALTKAFSECKDICRPPCLTKEIDISIKMSPQQQQAYVTFAAGALVVTRVIVYTLSGL